MKNPMQHSISNDLENASSKELMTEVENVCNETIDTTANVGEKMETHYETVGEFIGQTMESAAEMIADDQTKDDVMEFIDYNKSQAEEYINMSNAELISIINQMNQRIQAMENRTIFSHAAQDVKNMANSALSAASTAVAATFGIVGDGFKGLSSFTRDSFSQIATKAAELHDNVTEMESMMRELPYVNKKDFDSKESYIATRNQANHVEIEAQYDLVKQIKEKVDSSKGIDKLVYKMEANKATKVLDQMIAKESRQVKRDDLYYALDERFEKVKASCESAKEFVKSVPEKAKEAGSMIREAILNKAANVLQKKMNNLQNKMDDLEKYAKDKNVNLKVNNEEKNESEKTDSKEDLDDGLDM